MSAGDQGLVFVIDDEAPVRALTSQVLRGSGFATQAFGSVDELFASVDHFAADCVVTDLRMSGADGAELLRRLRAAGNSVSVVFVTGHADVRTVVRLMEDGAQTLLEKPYDTHELKAAVVRAIQRTRNSRLERSALLEAQKRLAQLDAETREVMHCLIGGMSNKAIVAKLQLSPRTLDRRKQSILSTMGVKGVAELSALVARVQSSDLAPGPN